MKIEFFSSAEELKSDRVPRKYSKKELIAQKNAARAINRIRLNNSDNKNSQNKGISL